MRGADPYNHETSSQSRICFNEHMSSKGDERHMDPDLWTLGLEIVYADFIWITHVLISPA